MTTSDGFGYTGSSFTIYGVTVTVFSTGSISLNGAVCINHSNNNADFQVRSVGSNNAIFVDASASKIGILTNGPQVNLDVRGTGNIARFGSATQYVGINRDDGNNSIAFAITPTGYGYYLGVNGAGNQHRVTPAGDHGIEDFTPDAQLEVSRDSGTGDIFYLSSSDDADGDILAVDATGVVFLSSSIWFNAITTPTVVSGEAGIFGFDQGGTTELKVIDSGGNITQISKHNNKNKAINPDIEDLFPMIEHDENVYLGIERWVYRSKMDLLVEQMLRDGGYLAADEDLVFFSTHTPHDTWTAVENRRKQKSLQRKAKHEADLLETPGPGDPPKTAIPEYLEIYEPKQPPQWLQDRGVVLEE
jgi:hypothetical protein